MFIQDLILNPGHAPTYDEISEYPDKPAQILWHSINSFIQNRYKASPKIMFSRCSAKPGWNVKYQKSGRALCTLYPERDGFVALLVIPVALAPAAEALSEEYEAAIAEIIRTSKPFNGTLWLMIPVKSAKDLENLEQMLILKQEFKISAGN